MQDIIKNKSAKSIFWKSLAYTPAVWFIGNIFMILIGALENYIANISWGGAWLFIPAFVFTLAYFIYQDDIRSYMKDIEW